MSVRPQLSHRAFLVSLTIAAAAASACTRDSLSPTEPGTATKTLAPSVPSMSRVGFAHLASTLRAYPGTVPYAYGASDLYVNQLPPSPCAPAPRTVAGSGETDIAICARIENPGAATISTIGIRYSNALSRAAVAPFVAALPPSPCRTYALTGWVRVSDALAADFERQPAAYALTVDGRAPGASSDALIVGGTLDGSAWNAIGNIRAAQPSAFGADACTIVVRPS